jgi:hypothetical protein
MYGWQLLYAAAPRLHSGSNSVLTKSAFKRGARGKYRSRIYELSAIIDRMMAVFDSRRGLEAVLGAGPRFWVRPAAAAAGSTIGGKLDALDDVCSWTAQGHLTTLDHLSSHQVESHSCEQALARWR